MVPKRCLEFILQISAMVASGGALAGATFIQMKYYDLTHAQRYIIDTITRLEDINKIVVKTQATAGIVFASVGVAVVVGTIALIGRIISSKKSEGKKRLYSCVYMLYVLASFLLFAAGGILGVFTAIDWFTLHNLPYLPSSIENDIENLRNSVAATSACSLTTALLFAVLEVVVLFCCSTNKEY